MNQEPTFDEKYVKNIIAKSGDEAKMRKLINNLTECIKIPCTDIAKVCERFNEAIKVAESNTKKQGIPTDESMNIVVSNFVCTVMGNMISIFDIDPKEFKKYVKHTLIQTSNIKKQTETEND